MRIKAKRFISLCLAVAIIATSVGYGPPAVGAEYMPYIELEEDASIATPSDAIRPDNKATPSEALPPKEKATPSEAEKRFIRVEPEEVPEYYQKASYAGRKFWKFDDRYGDEHYREFGFVQGEAELPLWYEANNQGSVEDYLSINPDEEYYDLAPYVYTSIKPENEDWDIISGHVLTGMKTLFKKEKIKFKNWDSSSYDVWALTTFEADNEDGNEELSFYFYGKIKNESEEGSGAEWYYADKDGNVLNKLISRSIRSLRSVYQLGLYFDIPWQLNSTKPNNTYDVTNQKTYNLPGLFDYGSNKSTHFGWVEGRNRAGNYADSSSGTTVFYNQDPAKVSTYASGRLYSQKYTIDLEKTYTSEYGAVWCPQDADVFIFCKQFENVSKGDFTTGNNYCIDTQAILVKRNTEFYASAAGIPKRDGFTFKGWYYYKSIIGGDVERVNIADDEKLIAGSSQKFTFIFPDWEANLNTVIFKDWDGTILSEQKIYSGNPAIAPILPDIPGKVFTGWSKSFSSVVSDMEIVAQYADVINVTINGNGGTVYGNEIYTMQAKIGKSWSSQLEGLVDNLKKEGSTFNKLYYLIDGTEYSLPQFVGSQDITIYVKWDRNRYNVIFDGNGGVSGTKTSVSTYAYYGDPALPPTPPVFTRQYRDFMGFANVKLNGVPITYETIVTGDATYYAVWDYHYTDIVYHDCIPDSEWTATVTRWSGDSSQFSNPIHPGRAGYSGPYWYTQPDGKGSVLYTFGDLLKGLLDGKDTLDVYALWNLVSYRYYCFKNTAEDQKTFVTVNYDVTMDDADLPEWESENGKVFIGYSTSKTGGGDLYKRNCDLPLVSSTYLYAQYVNKSYTVTFKDSDGTILNTQEVDYGKDAVLPEEPTRPGYTFTGWDKESTNILANTTITAKYSKNSYKLTLDGNGGTLAGKDTREQQLAYGDTFDQILAEGATEASQKYYTFAGWYTDKTGGSKYPGSGNTMPASNVTVYAQWTRTSNEVIYKDWDERIIDRQEIAIGGNATPPADPVRTGYTFTAWDKPSANIQDHTIITAQYSINNHKLILDGNGGMMNGSSTKVQQITYEASFDQALTDGRDQATRTYYTFEGWFSSPTGGSKYGYAGNKMPDADVSVYAHWTRTSNEVIYKDWDGRVIDRQDVVIGGDAKPPVNPSRTGYTFTGWDKESTNIQANTTITAQYSKNSYKLTLDGNGGTLAGKNTREQQLVYGDTFDQILTEGATEASQEYYTFAGWYTEKTGGSKYLESGNIMPASNVTVYAHWTRTSNEVIYKDWDERVIDRQEIAIGGNATPPADPSRTGFTFTGWDKASTNIQANTTITAQYSKNSYKLTLDGNGGTLNGKDTREQQLAYGDTFDQILVEGATEASQKYYTFAGWYTDKTGGSKYPGSGNTMPASNVTVYARWIRTSNEVIYKDWDGRVIDRQDVPIGGDAKPPVNPSKTGYTFTGWDKESINIQANTTITAQYSRNSYKLTLDGNGGTLNGKDTRDQQLAYGDTFDQILAEGATEASQKYYTFAGWYTDKTGGSKYSESGNTMPASNVMVYAHWTRTSNEVIYKDWDERVIDRQDVPIGGDARPPVNPSRTGYTFTGWDKESTNVQANTTITAQYSKNSYKLTLDGNGGMIGGNASTDQVVTYGESFDQILSEGTAKASQKYYTFAGWYTEKTGGSQYPGSGNTMPASNVTVYAHWTRTSNEVIYKDWDERVIDRQEIAIGGNATPPADPSRTGFTFTGWDKASTNIQANTTITAQYSKNSYKLTLDGNGGTLNGKDTREQQLAYGDSFDQILTEGAAKASQEYYTFAGWYTDKTGGSKYPGSGNIMPASNVTVYAHWTRTSNEVIYKDWDERVIDRQEIAIGGNATPPADPERLGYTFTGWDKESTNIQANTTITAKYSKNSYKLTLDGNGGTLAEKDTREQQLAYGDTFDQILAEGATEASQKYYTFAGWYTDKTGGSKYSESGNTMPASNVTVYAHWTRTSNEVIYKDWDERVIDRQEIAIGGNATPPADPSRTGFTFTGWDKASTNIQANTTITAQYSKNSYKLTLDGNGGNLNGKNTREQQLAYGDTFDQILAEGATEASQKYYTFAGWYTDKTGGSKYSESGNTMPASNVTVYAHWTRTSNEVIYKDWDERVIDRQEIAIGGNATPPADPSRTGFTFTGWDKASTNIQANTTITAQFSKNSYKLTLDGNGGSLNGKNTREQQLAYGDTFDQILTEGAAEASQEYYTFAGWYTDKTGGSKYPGSGNIMPASNVTVYAHWTRTSNEVVYQDWDGVIIDRQEVAIGGNTTPPADPSRTGFTFTGWDKESTNIQANTTITAQYSKNSYKLTLDGNGGSLNGKNTREQQLAYGDTFDQILIDGRNEVSRPGYTFIDWYSAPIGGDSYLNNGNRMPSNDLIVYAHWEVIQYTIHFDKNLNAVEKNPEDKIVAYGDVVGSLPIISAEGFTFLGWYTEPIGGTEVVESTPVSGNTTYYAHWDTAPKPTEPEPSKPESRDEEEIITVPVPPSIDSKAKPTVPDTGGTFEVNPDNPYEVTYTKPDGTTARDEWVGDGVDWYHVDEAGKLSYDWYLEGERTWYKLNKEPGNKFGAALICWNYEPMDGRKYFFDPTTTKMLTGWQKIDEKWYYFTERNEAQTYYGSNPVGWLYDPTKPGKPYGSMYKNEFTPDGYLVDENGVWTN